VTSGKVAPVTIIDPATLLLAAALWLCWHCRGHALRLVYAARAALLRRAIERDMGPLVLMVGAVNDTNAARWTRAVRASKPGPLAVIVHTYGGTSDARSLVCRALAEHPALTIAHVATFAWSAGTEIALACDHVVLARDANLGPVDPSNSPTAPHFCALAMEARERSEGLTHDDMRDENAVEETEDNLRKWRRARAAMFRREQDAAVEGFLVQQLVRGRWGNHWRPIYLEDAQAIGIDARPEAPSMAPRLAELARLAYLALPESER
jgi:hypothetical protein